MMTILLIALPKSYATIVIVMTHGQTKLNLEVVKSTLLAEWRKSESFHEDDSAVLAVRRRPAERSTPHSRGSTPHPRRKFQHRSKSRPFVLECWHCHEKGHRKRDCPSLKKKKHSSFAGASISSIDIVIADFDDGAHVLCTSAVGDNKWMLDSVPLITCV
uniref:CCHC-type domain-containing protein n=1 Tax=Physcomitrium patens TaxID=3218 RepID=A0A7I3Z110_PHYPA